MRLIVELDVLDTTISCSNDALVVVVIHLGCSDWVLSLDSSDHVSIIRRENLAMLISISNHVTLRASDHDLGMTVDDRTDCFTQNELLLSVFEPIKLLNMLHVLRVGVDCNNSTISRTNQH